MPQYTRALVGKYVQNSRWARIKWDSDFFQFCLTAGAKHSYCFSSAVGGVGSVNFCQVFWFSTIS